MHVIYLTQGITKGTGRKSRVGVEPVVQARNVHWRKRILLWKTRDLCAAAGRATFARLAHLNQRRPFVCRRDERRYAPARGMMAAVRGIEEKEFSMAEIRREETTGTSGLTTAALAHADEPAQQAYDTRIDGRDRDITDANPVNGGAAQTAQADEQAALFPANEARDFRSKWDAVQVAFVDEPRQAVERADSLVAEAMKRLAEMFAAERQRLEGQWDRGDSVSTEELRQALRRYRSFFGRLLSV